jgi:hypothetical protein
VKLLLICTAVVVPFAVFWLAGRGIKPSADGQEENAREVPRSDRMP